MKIEHYFREANGAADSLAKYGCSRAEPFVVFSQPPFVVLEALILDCILVPISRKKKKKKKKKSESLRLRLRIEKQYSKLTYRIMKSEKK